MVLTTIYDGNGALQGFGKIFRDDTASRRFQKELMRRALHDPLTGLPNRALLLDRLSKGLARLQRRQESVAVLFVDLDGFKAINDRLGHQAGDAVLVAVAERLRAALRIQDTVARLSGDEFVVLCEGLPVQPTAGEIAQRLATALAEPVVLGTEHVLVSASIGITVTQDAGHDLEALLREADTAMYHAKADRHSRHRIRFTHYDPAMQGRLPTRDSTLQAPCSTPDHRAQLPELVTGKPEPTCSSTTTGQRRD